jgi:hypothetical protein
MMPISWHFLKISVSRNDSGFAASDDSRSMWNTCLHPMQQKWNVPLSKVEEIFW